MNSAQQPETTTRLFARVLGPYLVIAAVAAVARASEMRALASDFSASPAWSWVGGAFVLLLGLIVVALHGHWRGAPAIIVSVLGWLTVLKGLFLLAFPGPYLSFANAALVSPDWWRPGYIVLALVGLYLTYVGWAPATIRTKAATTPPKPAPARTAS